MAFVARRSIEGKLVDCQVISGLRNSSLSVSDVSDDETDSGTVHGYSSRSYVSPTVRYVASKEEDDDVGSSYAYDGAEGRGLQRDLESVSHYGESYETGEESGNDQGAGGDYLSNDDESKSNISEQDADEKARYVAGGGDADRELGDSLSLVSNDEATVCSPVLQHDDSLSMFSANVDAATVCHSDVNVHDGLSMCSVDVATVCQPRVETNLQPDDTRSLDSMSSATVYRSAVKPGDDAMSTNTFDCQSQLTSRTYNVKSTTVRRDDCSSASTCSWTDMYGGALKQSESRSNIVPSLSLNLSTTSSSGSSTYFRTFDEKKERHGQAAYQEWVKRKERQKQQKQVAAKEQREKRDAELAMRQRLAKERYQQWCRQKEQQQLQLQQQQKKPVLSSIKSASSSTGYSSQSSSSGSGGLSLNRSKLQRKETNEAIKKRLEDWERVKKQQQLRDRERQRLQQQSKEQVEQQRRQRSEGAWQNWMKSVNKRAKPVPLNQGFDTLRGTISNIYVNPNQWVSNIDPHDSRGN
ncbi:hypothetical protein KR044_004091 [Drosophila immigrans]|nr:hypothetical protein KR044_004091 [Drosophila immigrans]